MTRSTLVIVGAGLAGAKAAESARDAGFDGRVVLVGDEAGPPYERPPLSKAVLRGEAEAGSTRVHPEGFYSEHAIDLVTDRVTAIDPVERRVELAGGDALTFDRAVIATGAAPRRLTVPGAELDGVRYLRNVGDSLALHDAIRAADRVAVVGAGWIGSEVAASAREMGAEVVLIAPQAVPLQRVLGARVGEVFRGLHAEHGVDLRLGARVRELRGAHAVREVVLDDGTVEAADLVIAGIGVIPRTDLAGAAGLRVENGVLVDHHLATDVPGVYAAGDVANAWHPHYRRHIRVEHWANALNQGAAAGRNAAGRQEVYDRLPYFFSDQYDLGMEYVGLGAPDDEVVVRGDLDAREFVAFWRRDGVVTAAMNVNVWDVVDDLKAIVAAGRPVDAERLGDADLPLAELAASGAR
ncbi:MAG TPA: FAD-dependent oxidoreductase [Acidimicrobiales bacterium]|nr:FAD-dependent oxidoreductase [Acidimicrobiales bacterium]